MNDENLTEKSIVELKSMVYDLISSMETQILTIREIVSKRITQVNDEIKKRIESENKK